MLLEVCSNVLDNHIFVELMIGPEVAQVNQFWKWGVRLMLSNLVDLALQLHLITVVVKQIWVVLWVTVGFLIQSIAQIMLQHRTLAAATRSIRCYRRAHFCTFLLCIVLGDISDSRRLPLSIEGLMSMCRRVRHHHSETLLVRHGLVLEAKVSSLEAFHQFAILGSLALLCRLKLRHNPWVN